MSNIAKIIRSDGEEAVQLPPGFQFEGDTVRIRRDGEAVILEPIVDEWAWLEAIAVKLDPASSMPSWKPRMKMCRSKTARRSTNSDALSA
ncbi:hypothetical protein MKK64_19705 [Methylobacterium sp. E-025]|uniref:antitoxin n=1 Tax=Methylobacterium sp. E-025 TaxID=2836561 RepID=UPI001FB94C4A|nr:hypothetical protein [Methylobacterium sp. E-025]MCJ2113402.1 hypothetical protein [Methylobacterium sp. E-025]